MPSQTQFSAFPKKPPQLQGNGLPKKSLPQPEFVEVTQTSPSKSGHREPHPHSPKPDFSTFPRKSPQPQASSLSKKSLPQPESGELPHTLPWKLESSEPQSYPPQLGFSTFPKKPPQPQLSDIPRKPPQLEFGELTRTSSEPEVSMLPKRPRQPEFKPLSKKPPQPELGGLPRTSSEPEFNLLPRKFPQPEHRGPPRKLSQPEPNVVLKKHPQPVFFRVVPQKSPLPGSVSESSLPTAIVSSTHRFPLSPGFGASGSPRWRSEDFKAHHLPRRRPLPSASSLGDPPAKPPLPPGPINIHSFRRPMAASTGGLRWVVQVEMA
jgi:hypothetical protein